MSYYFYAFIKKNIVLFFTLFFTLIFFTDAEAKRVALVIGNDNYLVANKLEKARNDADITSAELKKVGFSVTLHKDLTYRGMVKAIDTFSNSITGGDEVVVFYAGHGVQIRSGSYLLPTDIDADNENQIEKTAYSLNELTEKLSEAKASFSLIIIDACRDNPLKSKGRSVGNSRGLNAIEPAKGQMIVYSASRGQSALDRLSDSDSNPNSVFTREFIKGINQPDVPIEKIVKNLQNSVEEIARTIGHEQRPALYSEARGDFYFVSTPRSNNTEIAVKPQLIQPSKIVKISNDPFDIYGTIINSTPNQMNRDSLFEISNFTKDIYPPAFYFDTLVQTTEHLFILPKTFSKIGSDRVNISIAKRKIQGFLIFNKKEEGIMSVAIDCAKRQYAIHMETKIIDGKQSDPVVNGNPEFMGLIPMASGSVLDHAYTFACQPHGFLPIIKSGDITDQSWTFAFYNSLGNPVYFSKKFVQKYNDQTHVVTKTIMKESLTVDYSDIKQKILVQRFRINCKNNSASIDNESYSENNVMISKGNAYGKFETQDIQPNSVGSLAFDVGCK